MANMSLDEILTALEAAEPKDVVALAEKLMSGYGGDDKDLVEPDVMSMAFLASQANIDPSNSSEQ